jgi:flagellar biosynthesis/type III secretory pathway protein FliH
MSSKIIRAESPELGKVTRFDFATIPSELLDSSPAEPSGVPVQSEGALSPDIRSIEAVDTEPDGGMEPALAERQAEGVLQQARLRASQLEKEAYEKGFSEGERAGKEVGEKMVEAVLKQYASTLEELKGLRRSMLSSAEREVVKLALEVAKKVVKREVSIDEELVLALVKVSLSRLAEQSVMTLRVNPKDYQSILHYRDAPAHRDSLHEGIRVVEDPLITRGGCLMETESGIVDARVEEQFREIEKGFFE